MTSCLTPHQSVTYLISNCGLDENFSLKKDERDTLSNSDKFVHNRDFSVPDRRPSDRQPDFQDVYLQDDTTKSLSNVTNTCRQCRIEKR